MKSVLARALAMLYLGVAPIGKDFVLQLTYKHRQDYREQGYCLVHRLIEPELVAGVRRRVAEIVEERPDWPENCFQVLDPQRYQGSGASALPGGIQRPAQQEEIFARVAAHSELVAAMRLLLGGEVELYADQVGIKHGAVREEQGGRSYFHQDSFYWHIDPERGCNCWIPLDRVERDASALALMPGSHRDWSLAEHDSYYDDPPLGRLRGAFEPFKRHRIPPQQIDFSRELLLSMDPGDGLFFSNYTWHRSDPNRTGATLAFYAIAYQIRP